MTGPTGLKTPFDGYSALPPQVLSIHTAHPLSVPFSSTGLSSLPPSFTGLCSTGCLHGDGTLGTSHPETRSTPGPDLAFLMVSLALVASLSSPHGRVLQTHLQLPCAIFVVFSLGALSLAEIWPVSVPLSFLCAAQVSPGHLHELPSSDFS